MGICTSNQREHHHDGGTNRYVAPIAEETTRSDEPIRSNRRPATVAMSACEKLPQELIMAIAGNIWDDQNSLKAFSLVCKAWTNPAREHLFASLTIADFNNGLEKIRAANITSTYTPFLRHLTVMPRSPEFWRSVIPILADFRTTRLQSLVFKSLTWHWFSPDERSAFLRRFDSIISLRLSLLEQDKPNDIATIISSFPHLLELTLEPNWVGYASSEPFPLSPELPLPKRLSVLHIFSFCKAHQVVLEWLGSNPEQLSIHTFRVTGCWFSPRSFDAIDVFLKTLGPSLEIFGCNLYHHLFVDLTHNSHLRCIDFRFGLLENRGTEMLSAISTLSRIRSRQLEQVALHFGSSSWIDNYLHTEWIKLDTMLASSQFTALKSVCISGTLHPHDLPASFATLLPTCHARSIISFVGPPSW